MDASRDDKGFVPLLWVTSLVCGALIMVIEVLGSRVVGPFFGVSLFVWSSLIAVTMIALAAGYCLGGILSDRRGHPSYLYGLILAAGLLVLGVPLVKGWILKASMPLGLRLGAFVSSMVLFGPSLLLLGCVSPYIIRIAAREMQSIGRTVGGFYALSTVGSVIGTIATGFVLIVYVGVNEIFYLVGGLLILLALVYFVLLRRKWGVLLLALVPLATLMLSVPKPVRVTLPSGTVASVVYNVDTYYGNTKIVDYRYGKRHTRELLVDGSVQTGMDMTNAQSVYPYTYLLGVVPWGIRPGGENCLVVGLGGGVVPRWYEARGVKADVVDIDPTVVRLAEEYFGYKASGETVIADARSFLAGIDKRYDYVVMDVFSGEAAPAHVISLEALMTVHSRLAEKGVLALNLIGPLHGDDWMTASVVKTLRQLFANVDIYPSIDPSAGPGIGNLIIVAYDGAATEISTETMNAFEIHPMARTEVMDAWRWRYVMPERKDAIVLTDNYNPIDCYDNRVKEYIRKRILEGTHWDILIGSAADAGWGKKI